jgi:hypothetical protein
MNAVPGAPGQDGAGGAGAFAWGSLQGLDVPAEHLEWLWQQQQSQQNQVDARSSGQNASEVRC